MTPQILAGDIDHSNGKLAHGRRSTGAECGTSYNKLPIFHLVRTVSKQFSVRERNVQKQPLGGHTGEKEKTQWVTLRGKTRWRTKRTTQKIKTTVK